MMRLPTRLILPMSTCSIIIKNKSSYAAGAIRTSGNRLRQIAAAAKGKGQALRTAVPDRIRGKAVALRRR